MEKMMMARMFRRLLQSTPLILVVIILVQIAPLRLVLAQATDFDQRCLTIPCAYYDPNDLAAACDPGATDVAAASDTSGNAPIIFGYLVATVGLSAVSAAGVMGNMYAESRFNPKALEPGTTGLAPISGRGYGLSQWTYSDRQKPLIDRAAAAGKQVYDLGVQLDYIKWELTDPNSSFKSVGDELKKPQTIDSATDYYLRHYEIPADIPGAYPGRLKNARGILAKYGSTVSTSTTNASSTIPTDCGSFGQTSGDFSLPVDQKWYKQNPDWFSKPHHDYSAADVPVPSGTPVYALTGGTIIAAPVGGSCGLGVEVNAGSGVTYLYCHGMDGGTIAGAKAGDTIKAGQLIMHSDNTGHSTGAHLHIEIRLGGKNVCPQNLLVALGSGTTPLPTIQSLPATGCSY